MSDIVEKLRERAMSYRAGGPSSEHTAVMLVQAADEIERLRMAREDAQKCCQLMNNHIERLTAEYNLALREIARLRKGIQDYIDGSKPDRDIVHKNDVCAHAKFSWEPCEQCIDEYFTKVLNP